MEEDKPKTFKIKAKPKAAAAAAAEPEPEPKTRKIKVKPKVVAPTAAEPEPAAEPKGLKIKVKPKVVAAAAAAAPSSPKTQKLKIKVKPKANPWWPVQTRIPITLGEEVDAALAEWYGTRGLPIPPEEVGIGARIDKEERERRDQEMRMLDLLSKGKMEVVDAETGEMKEVAAPVDAGPKPEYGTPAFWRWAAKRRAEKNAELAAKGLPPLPTKKEKEAAKAARAASRAAKKAEKAAKAAEKEAKKAEKAAKKAQKE